MVAPGPWASNEYRRVNNMLTEEEGQLSQLYKKISAPNTFTWINKSEAVYLLTCLLSHVCLSATNHVWH